MAARVHTLAVLNYSMRSIFKFYEPQGCVCVIFISGRFRLKCRKREVYYIGFGCKCRGMYPRGCCVRVAAYVALLEYSFALAVKSTLVLCMHFYTSIDLLALTQMQIHLNIAYIYEAAFQREINH